MFLRRAALFVFALLSLPTSGQTTHTLKVTPQNVVIGYYDAKTPPVIKIASGDTVEIQTLGVATPDQLTEAGLDPKEFQPGLKAVVEAGSTRRGHILTGPVYVEGAEPGDVLEVRILAVKMDLPYSWNHMGNNGALAGCGKKQIWL
jgi:acetamidase/formamidase